MIRFSITTHYELMSGVRGSARYSCWRALPPSCLVDDAGTLTLGETLTNSYSLGDETNYISFLLNNVLITDLLPGSVKVLDCQGVGLSRLDCLT